MDCDVCGRPTFGGCGAHVEQVLGDVPRAQRCRCDEAPAARPAGAPPAPAVSTAPGRARS